jgi:hypothetical protein
MQCLSTFDNDFIDDNNISEVQIKELYHKIEPTVSKNEEPKIKEDIQIMDIGINLNKIKDVNKNKHQKEVVIE